jgi:CspA family cold shock protein
MTKIKGTVKVFFDFKNYGFITAEDSKEYFVHESSVADKKILNKDDKVEFEVEESPKGLKAVNVKVVN